MFLPTWGPNIFTIVAFAAQFSLLRNRMRRSDHISMFVAIAIFTLGTSFTIREMTPPELTITELLSFLLVALYSIALYITIYRGSHRKNERELETHVEGKSLKETVDQSEISKEKDMHDQDKIRLLAVIYEQYWLHARHVENERLWFTNIYAIILAGTLTLLGKPTYSGFYIAVLVFLISLSMIGMLFSLKVKLIFLWYTRKVFEIMIDYGLRKYWIDIAKPKTAVGKISVSALFPIFYAFCFSMLSCLLAYILTEQLAFALITFAILVSFLALCINRLAIFSILPKSE